MFPVVVGLNYRTAPVEVRERVSIHHSQMVSSLQKLRSYPGIEGALILSTCNRFEIYAVTPEIDLAVSSIENFLAELSHTNNGVIKDSLYTYNSYRAIKHLFRVVSGLDSMVLGETEILGQVAKAYEISSGAGTSDKIINVTFQKALAVGKKVRTETGIDKFSTSISYIAVEMAKQIVSTFKGKKILVLGTGEMSVLIMKNLAAQGAETFMISNRSYDRAEKMAACYKGQAIPFSELHKCLEEADLVFSATASKSFLIHKEQLLAVMTIREYRPLLMIDIAVPRDIDPEVKNIQGISLYDIDDLRGVADSHQSARELAALEAEKIIIKEMELFKNWYSSLLVLPTIAALKQKGEKIKNTQLDHALSKLGELTPKQEKVIRSLANSIINKVLHDPILTLKNASDKPDGHLYARVIQNTFSLEVDESDNPNNIKHNNTIIQMEKAE